MEFEKKEECRYNNNNNKNDCPAARARDVDGIKVCFETMPDYYYYAIVGNGLADYEEFCMIVYVGIHTYISTPFLVID